MTSNERYGQCNLRFDVRAAQLVAMGFKYTHLPEWDVAVFAKPRPGKPVPRTITASFVLLADDAMWEDRISSE